MYWARGACGIKAAAETQGKHTDWNRLPWPGTVVTSHMSCFTTGGPGKEQGTNKPPPTGRVQERSKGDTTCPITSQNPSLWHPSWLNKVCTTRKDSESEWLAKDNPETNPITIKPRLQACLGSLSLLLSTRAPFPNKISCFVSTCVSLEIHFQVLDKSPILGPKYFLPVRRPQCKSSKLESLSVPWEVHGCNKKRREWRSL